MAVQSLENDYAKRNPLDLLEEIIRQNKWPFSRTSEKELVVRFSGNLCEYNLCFGWVSSCSSMQFSSSYDLKVPKNHFNRSAFATNSARSQKSKLSLALLSIFL